MSALGALALIALGPAAFSRFTTQLDVAPSNLPQTIVWLAAGISLFFSLIYLVLAYGLWTMKNWGRITVLVLSVLGLLGSIAQTAVSLTGLRQLAAQTGAQQMTNYFLCAVIPEFAISAAIIFWFWANRDLFT